MVEEGSLASIYMTFLGGMLDGDSDTDIKRDGKEQDGKGVGKVSPDSMNAECSAFVRNLVHHTFRDAYGYVEELTEAKVDEAIRKYYITAISNNQ